MGMGLGEKFRKHALPYWRIYVVVLTPLLLLPLPILATYETYDGHVYRGAMAGYVILIMSVYWMTEALPLAVTSLIPVVFFPLFGIMDTSSVTMAYMKDTNMMFIGGLMLALTIEYCNLHKRMALGVLSLVGASPRWLMLGFMVVTAFLSMWISNTATTAMMVPIVEAVVSELFYTDHPTVPHEEPGESIDIEDINDESKYPLEDAHNNHQHLIDDKHPVPSPKKDEDEQLRNIRAGVLLSVAYASNIGGTGSLIGSTPQLAFMGVLENWFPKEKELNFATYMAFNLPGMITNVFVSWLWLQFRFIGFKRINSSEAERNVKKLIKEKYRDLGPWTFHEAASLCVFIFVILLWFFRDPHFITGWSQLISGLSDVDDAAAAVAAVVLLFAIPAKPNFWCFRNGEEAGPEAPSEALLSWQYVQDRLPWGVVLLLGGGFAVSEASRESGLSDWMGEQLIVLNGLPPSAIMFIICLMTTLITEVASNTATAYVLLPIIAELSLKIEVNPIYLMLPVAVTCSYAFMLPVATPSNAIVFSASKMKQIDLVKAGFLMNLFCVFVICTLMQFYGEVFFSDQFPEWAWINNTNITAPCL